MKDPEVNRWGIDRHGCSEGIHIMHMHTEHRKVTAYCKVSLCHKQKQHGKE
jgi:hypothetical protein